MIDLTNTILIMTIVSLVMALIYSTKIIKSQGKRISDLLDRITSPSFQVYQNARERELVITEAKKGIDTIIEEYGEPDGLRLD